MSDFLHLLQKHSSDSFSDLDAQSSSRGTKFPFSSAVQKLGYFETRLGFSPVVHHPPTTQAQAPPSSYRHMSSGLSPCRALHRRSCRTKSNATRLCRRFQAACTSPAPSATGDALDLTEMPRNATYSYALNLTLAMDSNCVASYKARMVAAAGAQYDSDICRLGPRVPRLHFPPLRFVLPCKTYHAHWSLSPPSND